MLITMRNGFTLLEGLLVLGIISFLSVSTMILLNPTEHLNKAKNTQRKADVLTILNAIHQYATDHHGNFPVCIDSSVRNICAGKSCEGVTDNCNLYPLVGKYIVGIPVDPDGSVGNDSQYDVSLRSNGRITVSAPRAERGEEISVTQ